MTKDIASAGMPLWITWETQRRNKELSLRFGARYLWLDFSRSTPLVRYAKSLLHTIPALARGKQIFVQCPSVVLMSVAALARKMRRFTLVIDAHNSVFETAESWFGGRLVRFCFSTADYVIVSNDSLRSRVEDLGGRPLILPDPLPEIPERSSPAMLSEVQRPVVTLISTFAPDEPIEEFIHGARESEGQFTLFITGRKEKAGNLLALGSDRVRFTGFLSEADFEGLIRHSDLLVDLTTREGCLVCGAYEALAVSVPVLLSDTSALRACFGEAAHYAANDRKAFAAAIRSFLSSSDGFRTGIEGPKKEFCRRWQESFDLARKSIFAKSEAH